MSIRGRARAAQLAKETSISTSNGYTPSPPEDQNMVQPNQPINLSSLLNLPGRGRAAALFVAVEVLRIPWHLMAVVDLLNWTPLLAFRPRRFRPATETNGSIWKKLQMRVW
ncbi:hypothetical protein RHSIM_Rhsim09G0065500 [Rhododendron simsii]|uniref:Uncharacterized protein n=1 Tax=Rhododendron simsii TaxID=118357 RepID=A0A834GHT7_RHOSS|nr:hypothetical protein RHSIM_Rhsim09G0065500 [Rhododendron simsii]